MSEESKTIELLIRSIKSIARTLTGPEEVLEAFDCPELEAAKYDTLQRWRRLAQAQLGLAREALAGLAAELDRFKTEAEGN